MTAHPSHAEWWRGVCQRCRCRRALSQASMPCPWAARPAAPVAAAEVVLAGSGALACALGAGRFFAEATSPTGEP